MLARFPGIFGAGVPISGGGFPDEGTVEALQDVPLWFFHGSGDGTVPPSWSSGLYDALVAAGSPDVHLSLVPGGHSAGYEFAFRDATNTFYPWLFSRTLSVPIPEPDAASLAGFAAAVAIFAERRTRKM
jgi:fermentation-respiration switch protein FrsA (DUF1100 family)